VISFIYERYGSILNDNKTKQQAMTLNSVAPKTQAALDLVATATPAWLSVVRAYNLCDAVLGQRLAALGLRLGEHEVLANLLRTPGITQQVLAQRCFVAKSGVSVLVSRMQEAGWVQRNGHAKDARVWCLSLTPAGLALAKKTHKLQTQVVAAMAAGTTLAELDAVMQVMQRASTALQGLLDETSS
jgi:DNA-binding MarR family transcriptional regulator